ncbi:MAG: hypothetical protein HS111_08010 [Kofleriaceae bacterium]|nr:hypothetical protein [Kofleriaceae bacterium]MCL4224737.1 hypothetical protein [Myxococcales bacterium]
MPPATQKKHFAGQHIALLIDGDSANSAYLKSAEGGMIKATSTEEPGAGYHLRERHLSTREISPLTLEFGIAGAKWAMQRVKQILANSTHDLVSGQIIHADTNFVQQYLYEFADARITEFTLPKLDAKGKEVGFLKMVLQPEAINFGITKGAVLAPGNVSKQKSWVTSGFSLSIGGVIMASSIEALSVKVGAKAYQTGPFKLPQYAPTGKIEMPKLVFTVPMAHAATMVNWFQSAVIREQGLADGDKYEKDAIIEYLDTTRKKTLYTIELERIGPETLEVVKDDSSTKSMKFTCYITGMKVHDSGEGLI